MVTDKLCSVCGYEMEEGPRDYNICPSCGTEFGIHDLNSSIENLRGAWLSSGPRWYSRVVPEPQRWNPIQQLSNVFLNPNAAGRVSYQHHIQLTFVPGLSPLPTKQAA